MEAAGHFNVYFIYIRGIWFGGEAFCSLYTFILEGWWVLKHSRGGFAEDTVLSKHTRQSL